MNRAALLSVLFFLVTPDVHSAPLEFTSLLHLDRSGCTGVQTGLSVTDSFSDPLPTGALVKRVRIGLKMARWDPPHYSSSDPVIRTELNGSIVGADLPVSTYSSCDFSADDWVDTGVHWVESIDFPQNYVYGGLNSLKRTVVSGGWASNDGVYIELVYEQGFSISVQSGTNQKSLTEMVATTPLVARLGAYQGNTNVANQPVTFTVTSPSGSSPAVLGTGGNFVGQSLTVNTDATGLATVEIMLGDGGGVYTIEATNPDTTTGDSAVFSVTGIEPTSIVIAKIQSGFPSVNTQYTVALGVPETFQAFGQDASGTRLPMPETQFSTATPKGSKDPASLSLQSDSDSSKVEVEAMTLGTANLVASPPVGKYQALKEAIVSISVGAVYLDADGNFDPASPTDDRDWWRPGSLDVTRSVAPPNEGNWAAPLQQVWIHVPAKAPKGTKSPKVTFTLVGTSNYRGVAMNWPPENVATDDFDLWFDLGGARVQSLAVDIDPDGMTSVPLFVGDYAAKATMTVMVDGSSGSILVPLPKTGSDGMPVDGWWALADSAIGEYEKVSATFQLSDYDTNLLGDTSATIGDGFPAWEEYRGFVVRGSHRRLSPVVTDVLVIWPDPDLEMYVDKTRYQTLPIRRHELWSPEVLKKAVAVEEGYPPAARAVVNPNGSIGIERVAVWTHAVPRAQTPEKLVNGLGLPIWETTPGVGYGFTKFVNGQTISLSALEYSAVYEASYVQRIKPGPDGTIDSTYVGCESQDQDNCDDLAVDPDDLLPYLAPGPNLMIDAVCHPSDGCVIRAADCVSSLALREVTTVVLQDVVWASHAHELGHSVGIFPNHPLTFDAQNCTYITQQGNLHIRALSFSAEEIKQIRLK